MAKKKIETNKEELKKKKNVIINKTKTKLIIPLEERERVVVKLYCKHNEIIKKSIYKKNNIVSSKTKILDVSLDLISIYSTSNNERLYEVKLGNEDICLRKSDLINFIENERNYAFTSGKELKESVSIILREYEKQKNLKIIDAYPTIGIFLNKHQNMVIVYPSLNNIHLFGENTYQRRMIEKTGLTGLDKKGELVKVYYDLIHSKTIPRFVRLITIGHSIILPFFYVLKEFLDVFPYHFWITPERGVGKTTFFEIFYNYLYGTELKVPDDIDSPARATKNATSHTFALNIDDIDKLNYKTMNFLKVHGTRMKGRERMRKDQKLDVEDTYVSFVGTANSNEFLSGEYNEAFRGRCFISTDYNKIDINNTSDFEKLFHEIKANKIFGIYTLKKSLEFIDKYIDDKNLTNLTKLKRLYNDNKKKIKDFLSKNNVKLSDTRRFTMYSLIYTGLELWNYIFNENNLKSPLLEQTLNLNNNNNLFVQLIKIYEDIDSSFIFQDFENIMSFFNKYSDRYIYYKEASGKIVMTSDFINDYDDWARRKGYETLKHLTTLGDMQSKLLKMKCIPDAIRFIDTRTNEKFRKHGLILHLEEIRKLFGIEKDTNERETQFITINKKNKKQIAEIEVESMVVSSDVTDESDDSEDYNKKLNF